MERNDKIYNIESTRIKLRNLLIERKKSPRIIAKKKMQ